MPKKKSKPKKMKPMMSEKDMMMPKMDKAMMKILGMKEMPKKKK